jgi:hypothetical protein
MSDTIGFVHWQLGDLATWFGSVGVVGTLAAALFQIRTERLRRHEAEEREQQRSRRQQAERVAGWPGGRASGPHLTPLVLLNRSDQPVYEVVVTLVMVQGGGPRRSEDVVPSEFRRTLAILPPGRWAVEVAGGWAGMSRRPGVEVAFTDRAGVQWIRRAMGALDEIRKAPIDYYGLSRPQELGFPTPDEDRPPSDPEAEL